MELLFRSETADSSQHAYVGPPSLFEQSCDECSSSPRVNPARAMTAHDIRTTVIQMKKDHGLKPMTDRMLLGRTSLTVSQNAKCATRRSVRRLLLRPRPACGERAAHEFQQARLGEGEGQAPHPFFVVELPNSPLPASGERAQQQPPDVCDTVRLEWDEFRFALPLNQSPFVPAEASRKRGPGADNSAKELGPRVRGDERNLTRRFKFNSSRASDAGGSGIWPELRPAGNFNIREMRVDMSASRGSRARHGLLAELLSALDG
jgi:hypothetical protein